MKKEVKNNNKKVVKKQPKIELYDLDEEIIDEEDFEEEEEKSSIGYKIFMTTMIIILIAVLGVMGYLGYLIYKDSQPVDPVLPEVSIEDEIADVQIDYTLEDNLLTVTYTASADGYYFSWLLVDHGNYQSARCVLASEKILAGETYTATPVVLEEGTKYIIKISKHDR